MGFIDKTTVEISCPSCKQCETLTAREKGSSSGSSGWTNFRLSILFNIISESNIELGPSISSASCIRCGCDAVVKQE